MVNGIDIFREHFNHFKEQYTVIGGFACDLLMNDPYQHGVVINALNNLRNDLIEDKRPTDIVDEVLIKTVDAPSKSKRVKQKDER